MLFIHPKFPNDLSVKRLTSHFLLLHTAVSLFLHGSSLQKQPFITAHFRSSLHVKTSPGLHSRM